MKEFEIIKEFFKPIQPTIKADNKEISYQEKQPQKEVNNFIYCFWRLKTRVPLKYPFVYRVVSDGCIDILFNHKQLSENFIVGFCRRYSEFQIGKEFDYIGVRFLPAAFPILFKINAKTLVEQTQELKLILPDFSEWIETNLTGDLSFNKMVELLNNKFNDVISKKNFDFDPRFFNALNLILRRNGFLDIEKDLNTGSSARQLRRIFNFYIGTTPKAFSNIVRFQYILNSKPSSQNLKNNKLYFDVGFFDQAHFIKTFKTFYGITPSKAFE